MKQDNLDPDAELKMSPVVSTDCCRGLHKVCEGSETSLWTDGTFSLRSCSCACHVPEELDVITDVVLAYRPKPKSMAAKKRARKAKRDAKTADRPG